MDSNFQYVHPQVYNKSITTTTHNMDTTSFAIDTTSFKCGEVFPVNFHHNTYDASLEWGALAMIF